MARRKSDSPQKAAMREMMQGYLKENDISIKSGNDVNSIMRDMMSVLLEGVLDEELNEELGYSKYDYRNKETDNSRNGHSKKTMHTSYGDMDVAIPRDRKGEYEPRLIQKYQNTVTQDMEEKIILCDETEIERCIINLLANAVKFTDEGGKIEVLIDDVDDNVEIRIKDTGIGIDEKDLEGIFNRFGQAYNKKSEEFGGSGIGLTLTKQLIELHNGKLLVESEVGVGSTFIIILPKYNG